MLDCPRLREASEKQQKSYLNVVCYIEETECPLYFATFMSCKDNQRGARFKLNLITFTALGSLISGDSHRAGKPRS